LLKIIITPTDITDSKGRLRGCPFILYSFIAPCNVNAAATGRDESRPYELFHSFSRFTYKNGKPTCLTLDAISLSMILLFCKHSHFLMTEVSHSMANMIEPHANIWYVYALSKLGAQAAVSRPGPYYAFFQETRRKTSLLKSG
jgi:hypothetical protein